jgi:hypothetical protein
MIERSPDIPESGKVLIDWQINSEAKVFSAVVISVTNCQTRNSRNALGLISAGSSFKFLHPKTPSTLSTSSSSGRKIKNETINLGIKIQDYFRCP